MDKLELRMIFGYFIEVSTFLIAGYKFGQHYYVLGFMWFLIAMFISFIVGKDIEEIAVNKYKKQLKGGNKRNGFQKESNRRRS